MSSNMLAHTTVYHKGTGFIISTIDRESSAPYGGRYSETIVWDIRKSDILHMDSAAPNSVNVHVTIVERVFDDGAFWDNNNED